jgi:hypothetical protein
MVATLANNPYATTVGHGLFLGATAEGLVQGTAYPDPSATFQLRRGWLSSTETLPMWGGCAIYEFIPGGAGVTPMQALGVQVGRATSLTGGAKPIMGFSTFDQSYGSVGNPSSPVPLAASFGQVMSYRLGSGVRLAVACDPGLVSAQGATIFPPVTWDLVNQLLIPSTNLTVSIGSYVGGTGVVTLNTTVNHGLNPGDSVTVSGITGTGANLAAVNGTFTLIAPTGANQLVYQIAPGLTITTITGGAATTGAPLTNIAVLEVQSSNCVNVAYNAAQNTAAWNYNGACAVIQI